MGLEELLAEVLSDHRETKMIYKQQKLEEAVHRCFSK